MQVKVSGYLIGEVSEYKLKGKPITAILLFHIIITDSQQTKTLYTPE